MNASDSAMLNEEGDLKVSLVQVSFGPHKYMVVRSRKMYFYTTRSAQIPQKQNDAVVQYMDNATNILREGTQKYIGRTTP